MSAESAVASGRDAAERLMTDYCTISHPGGTAGAYDPETVTSAWTPNPPHYEGRCRVKPDAAAARDALVADQNVAVRIYTVTVPADVDTVRVGDWLTVVESVDSMLVDASMYVADVQGGTYVTARRLVCSVNLNDRGA